MSKTVPSLATLIYERRSDLSLTQEALGKLVGVSGAAVAKWEAREGFPAAKRLGDLAVALRVGERIVERSYLESTRDPEGVR